MYDKAKNSLLGPRRHEITYGVTTFRPPFAVERCELLPQRVLVDDFAFFRWDITTPKSLL